MEGDGLELGKLIEFRREGACERLGNKVDGNNRIVRIANDIVPLLGAVVVMVDDQPDRVGERVESSFDMMAVSLAEERLNTRWMWKEFWWPF